MEYKDHIEIVKNKDKKLTAYDFEHTVIIVHDEGIYLQNSAIAEVSEDKAYLYTFAEHDKARVWEMDSIKYWAQFDVQYPERDLEPDYTIGSKVVVVVWPNQGEIECGSIGIVKDHIYLEDDGWEYTIDFNGMEKVMDESELNWISESRR